MLSPPSVSRALRYYKPGPPTHIALVILLGSLLHVTRALRSRCHCCTTSGMRGPWGWELRPRYVETGPCLRLG
ncbi:hypothetical protein F4780DRAFT_718366 [Xylariomycetidae sp. FL0641]|nr:hypothetical protein F4780DRAFT_718366 [Xylariomycetidae sp. FL0641]